MVAFDQGTLLVLLLILVLGMIVPELFRRFKLPFVTCLILFGSILGPHGTGYIQSNAVIEFFGFLGAAFLMLMAGLDVQTKHLQAMKKRVFIMAAMNGIIPFIVGLTITKSFGYSWTAALMVGVIFISSSVAIVISSVSAARLMKTEIGMAIISSAVLMDVTSLLVLALILQSVSPITPLPLPVYFLVLLISIFVLKRFLPPLARLFFRHLRARHIARGKDEYEDQLHLILIILIAVLLYFSGLGVHPIVAAFVVGLLLSDVMTSKILHHKLHTIAYGLFVPVFFFLVGTQLDLSLFVSFDLRNVIVLFLVVGLIASKFVSGYISGRWVGFSQNNAAMFGIGSTAQLTTTLAVTYAASSLGILDDVLVSSVVVLAIITTVFSPIALNYLAQGNVAKAVHKFFKPKRNKLAE